MFSNGPGRIARRATRDNGGLIFSTGTRIRSRLLLRHAGGSKRQPAEACQADLKKSTPALLSRDSRHLPGPLYQTRDSPESLSGMEPISRFHPTRCFPRPVFTGLAV